MDPVDPKFDRLKLTADRIRGCCRHPECGQSGKPRGKILKKLPAERVENYQGQRSVWGHWHHLRSRPNVTFDVFALCLKSETPAF
jgi:glutamate-5-semialdehyde dehydrogenase